MIFKKKQKKNTGYEAEDRVVKFLKKQGHLILERNYRTRYGEIDIIYIEKSTKTLVFAEVKYRKNSYYGEPYQFVDHKKLKRIEGCAENYLAYKAPKDYKSVRIDVFSVKGEGYWIEQIKDVTF